MRTAIIVADPLRAEGCAACQTEGRNDWPLPDEHREGNQHEEKDERSHRILQDGVGEEGLSLLVQLLIASQVSLSPIVLPRASPQQRRRQPALRRSSCLDLNSMAARLQPRSRPGSGLHLAAPFPHHDRWFFPLYLSRSADTQLDHQKETHSDQNHRESG